ncbi:MAG: hypothetical protein FD139_2895 [Methylocystaceae bacterium]|nr:MAG: hypothetical protein FD139_2895 [Methylocystaceae bacterium]
MLESDSPDLFSLEPAPMPRPPRLRPRRPTAPSPPPSLPEFQPFPHWARLSAAAGGAGNAFFAGAALARLDQILRAGAGAVEPGFSGALRQRLALKAAATSARLARLREDDAALRDAEHLGGAGLETSPAGRVHRFWRLFATRSVKFDVATLSLAAEHLGAPSAFDAQGIAEALRQTVASANDPLAAAAGVSAAAMHDLAAVPAIDAEIFALWLADVALAQKLGWQAPVPLLATVILYPALRRDPNGRRRRPDDRDWSNALASAYALAAGEAKGRSAGDRDAACRRLRRSRARREIR